jgi:AraC-like DNA-binding protein
VRTRLYDPRRQTPSITLETINWTAHRREPERTNSFSIYWIESGAGTIDVDITSHPFGPHSLLFVSPYRRIRFTPAQPVRGAVIRFHANYLCVETFHAESGCSGALFNDPFGSPAVSLPSRDRADVRHLVRRIADELDTELEGAEDMVVASLKILLVLATRLKTASNTRRAKSGDYRHPLTHRLNELVEQHYRHLHAPAEYARLLNLTPKALGRFTKTHFGRTMTEILRERLLIDAKWDLLHTLKPVKQIAGELGFEDELYFSRFFKKAVGRAPTAFRAFETEIRGGRNLSMSLARPAIPGIPPSDGR